MDQMFPLVAMLTAAGLLYLALRAHQARQQHRERMAAIDKGIDIKPILLNAVPAFGHRLYLLRGLVWLLAGVALAGVLAVTSPLFKSPDRGPVERLEYKLHRARALRDLGGTPEQIDAMEKEIERAERRHEPPPPLQIAGLIPISVGIAYMIFYLLEEKRMRSLPPA